MPDWVKDQIDMSDYVAYLQPPVGTWDGKTYRITIDVSTKQILEIRRNYDKGTEQLPIPTTLAAISTVTTPTPNAATFR